MESKTKTTRSLSGLYVLALLLSLGCIGAGVAMMQKNVGLVLLGAGAMGLITTLATWPIAVALGGQGSLCGNVSEALAPRRIDRGTRCIGLARCRRRADPHSKTENGHPGGRRPQHGTQSMRASIPTA